MDNLKNRHTQTSTQYSKISLSLCDVWQLLEAPHGRKAEETTLLRSIVIKRKLSAHPERKIGYPSLLKQPYLCIHIHVLQTSILLHIEQKSRGRKLFHC